MTDSGTLRALRRAGVPRAGAARHRCDSGARSAGAFDRRRRLHERADAEAIAAARCLVWLKAEIDTLMERVSKKQNRPLLKAPIRAR
jgi:hypothetical protein